MTVELSKYVIDAIADAVVKKMQKPKTGHWKKMVNVYDTMSGTHIRVPYTVVEKLR